MKLLLENWKKFLNEGKEDFEPHIMYDPKTGEEQKAKTYKRHLELKKKGWAHEKPQLDETKNEDGKEQGVDGKAIDMQERKTVKTNASKRKQLKSSMKLML